MTDADAPSAASPGCIPDPSIRELFDAAYDTLHDLAVRAMRRQPKGHTLQPTALLHEAVIKLIAGNAAVRDTEHLRAIVARAMRQVLIDHARGKNRKKRDRDAGLPRRLPETVSIESRVVGLLDLHDALVKLRDIDPDLHAVAELKAFGAPDADIAAQLDCSIRTVERRWRAARAWLLRELG